MKVAMKKDYLIGIFSFFLTFFLAVDYFYLQKARERHAEDDRYKVVFALKNLDLVFPAYNTIPSGTKQKEPDLKTIVDDLNDSLRRSLPSRPVKVGGKQAFVHYQPMVYRIGKPDDSWQVVLSYEKAAKLVKAEAYGADLSAPMSVREYPACH